MVWVNNKYPEPGKNVLVYDLIEGIVIGYHDNWHGNKYFFTSNTSSPLTMVACWQELPNKPNIYNTMRDNIHKKEMVIRVKVEDSK